MFLFMAKITISMMVRQATLTAKKLLSFLHFLDTSLFKHLHQVAYICEDVYWFGDNADVVASVCQKDETWSGCCHLHHSICDDWRVQTIMSLEDALSWDIHVPTAEVFESCNIRPTEETENRHVFSDRLLKMMQFQHRLFLLQMQFHV